MPIEMQKLLEPIGWGSAEIETFSAYRSRWPECYSHIPDAVIETWIHRHWREFQQWMPLNPLDWKYEVTDLSSDDILSINHVGDWPKTLKYWGDDLFDGNFRKNTPLGQMMLKSGTTPAPMIVAKNADACPHPREGGRPMCTPYQIIEGHMRLAYLQAMIRRKYELLRPLHQVVIATLPSNVDR